MDDADEEIQHHLLTPPRSGQTSPSRMTSSPLACMDEPQFCGLGEELMQSPPPGIDPIASLDLSPISVRRPPVPFLDDTDNSERMSVVMDMDPACSGWWSVSKQYPNLSCSALQLHFQQKHVHGSCPKCSGKDCWMVYLLYTFYTYFLFPW